MAGRREELEKLFDRSTSESHFVAAFLKVFSPFKCEISSPLDFSQNCLSSCEQCQYDEEVK